jgi:hypothetical protein
MEPEKDEHFEVELFDPTGGAKLGAISRMAVTITNDDGKIFQHNFLAKKLICLYSLQQHH